MSDPKPLEYRLTVLLHPYVCAGSGDHTPGSCGKTPKVAAHLIAQGVTLDAERAALVALREAFDAACDLIPLLSRTSASNDPDHPFNRALVRWVNARAALAGKEPTDKFPECCPDCGEPWAMCMCPDAGEGADPVTTLTPEVAATIRARHGILHRCLWGNQEDAVYVMGDKCDAIRALDAYEALAAPTKDNGERLTYHGETRGNCEACGWGVYAHECPSLADGEGTA